MTGFLTQLSPEVRRQIIDLLAQVGIERGRIDEILSGSSTVDHGALIGLGDNDHPQYALLTALNDEATLRANQDIVLQNNIDLKAPINDPVFTGLVTVTDEVTFPPGPGIKMRLASGGVGADYWIGIDNPLTFHLNTAFNGKFQFTQDTGLVDLMDIDELGVEVFVAPTLPQHLTRKDYVDAGDIVNLSWDVATRTVSSDTGGTNAVISQASSAFPAFWGLQSGANAKLAEDAAPQAALDAHVTDLVDAHDANSIGFSYDGGSSLINGWLGGAATVEEAVEVLSAQLYTPDEETTEAMIAAANALVIADPDAPGVGEVQFNNSNIFASNVIVARHIVAGSINAAKIAVGAVTADAIDAGAVTTDKMTAGTINGDRITAGTLDASKITAGSITTDRMTAGTIDADRLTALSITATQIAADAITATKIKSDAITSSNYIAPPLPGDYAIAGSYLNLANGDFQTPGFLLDGVSGDTSMKGSITATDLTLLLNDGVTYGLTLDPTPTDDLYNASVKFKHGDVGLNTDVHTRIGWNTNYDTYASNTFFIESPYGYTTTSDFARSQMFMTTLTNTSEAFLYSRGAAVTPAFAQIKTQATANSSSEASLTASIGGGAFSTFKVAPTSIVGTSDSIRLASSVFSGVEVYRSTANYAAIQYSNSVGGLGKAGFNNSSQFIIRTGAAGSDELTFTGSSIQVPSGGIETNYGDSGLYVNVGASMGSYPTWKGVEGKNGVLLMSQAGSGHVYLRNKSTSNIVYMGVGTSNKFQVWNAGAKALGWLEASGQIQSLHTGTTTSWDSANILANPSSGNATMSFHPGAIALQLRVGYGVGTMYVRNSADSGTYTVYAYHAVPSSGEWKHDIQTWGKGAKAKRLGKLRPDTNITGNNRPVDDPDIPSPLEAVKKLRTVAYRLDKTEQLDRVPPEESRQKALSRLNEMRRNQGLGPFQSEETIHLCGRDCDSTPEDPCVYVKDWEKGRVGFISEELAEVLPEAVRCDPISGKWNGIDTLAVTAAAVGAIQEQQEIIDGLLARIEALEAAL